MTQPPLLAPSPPSASTPLTRREVLRCAGAMVAGSLLPSELAAAKPQVAKRRKRIVVAGGGIGGLCCAYELMERGHNVTVLKASGRAGGHVRTIRDPLPGGLYADVGAEHFTKPGYDQLWKYVNKLHLPVLSYPRRRKTLQRINGQWYTDEQLHDRQVLRAFGFKPPVSRTWTRPSAGSSPPWRKASSFRIR